MGSCSSGGYMIWEVAVRHSIARPRHVAHATYLPLYLFGGIVIGSNRITDEIPDQEERGAEPQT